MSQRPHANNPMPYGAYFVLGFMLGTIGGALAVAPLRDLSLDWPVGARLALAVSPLVLGAAYGARVFTFGRAERLSVRAALRRGLGLSAGPAPGEAP